MNESRATRSASEPALLTSLGAAVREVVSAPGSPDEQTWVNGGREVAEEIRRFRYEFDPLIEQAVLVQRELGKNPEIQKLGAEAAAAARIGTDGMLSPRALELALRLQQTPALLGLGSSAASSGVKGMGFLTANAEAALIIGGQAGAELVWLWPYKIGTFRTPNRVVGRAWATATIGLDLGLSLTVVPFPLDLSFWFVPPENSNHMVGAYATVVAGTGIRVELFGWIPEKPGDTASTDISIDSPFDYIFGFRIVAEIGLHVGLGVAFKGRQVAANKVFDLVTYYLSPSNLQATKKYDGSDADHPLIEGIVSPPQRDEQPSKIFKKGSTTLQLNFPSWMCSAMAAAPPLTFKNDGGGGTGGWLLTSTPTVADPTYTYQWTGLDGQAWQGNIDFTIAACSKDAPPQSGNATCQLKGLENVGTVDVPVSACSAAMTLSAQVFTANGGYTLNVDPNVNTIEDYDGTSLSGSLKASNADTTLVGENNFYYLPDPADPTKPLIIDEKGSTNTWYVGYQFQQQAGTSYAQFRSVFWQYGKPAKDVFYYYGLWATLQDPSQKYTSTATWSNGMITPNTTLSITLTPTTS